MSISSRLAILVSIALAAVPGWSDDSWAEQLAVAQVEPVAQVETIEIDVDWDWAVRDIPAYAYGVNSPANFVPEYSGDYVFMNNLEFITQKKGFVRLHGWGMVEDGPQSWQENGVWDSDKIGDALRPLVDEGYTVMINIPSGPQGEHDYLDPASFAEFAADLVRIVNIEHELGVTYWEIPNEREAGFAEPGLRVEEMATLIRSATQQMKAVDPSIAVGGPATAWVNVDYVSDLVEEVYPGLDFVTVHTYSGDGTNTVDDAYDIAQSATGELARLRERLDVITGDDYLPIFVTEHNISYIGSPWVETNKGAVYDAIILTESIAAGADSSMYWNVHPSSDMSVLDGDAHFESAHVFEVFNQSFHGALNHGQSQDPSQVVVYAVSDQDSGDYAFALINRTGQEIIVDLDFTGWMPSTFDWHLWDEETEYSILETEMSGEHCADEDGDTLVLSAYSVNLLVSR